MSDSRETEVFNKKKADLWDTGAVSLFCSLLYVAMGSIEGCQIALVAAAFMFSLGLYQKLKYLQERQPLAVSPHYSKNIELA